MLHMPVQGSRTMNTEHYPHKIAAIYLDESSTLAAKSSLEQANIGDIRVRRLDSKVLDPETGIEPEQEETRNRFIQDILVGGAIGTAAGTIGAGATAMLLPSLFVSAPVVAPLVVIGYGATLGSGVGAIKSMKVREDMLAGLVEDALKENFHVLVVHAPDTETRKQAETVIEASMAEKVVTS